MTERKLTAGVKYCGHCNPQEDGPALVRKLQSRLPELKVVPWNDRTYDVLLVVSACPSDCATRPAFNGPRIEVAAGEVRYWQVPPGHPAEHLLQTCLEEGIKVFRFQADRAE
ncbi:hypothetical protein [Desulfofundulus thermosubterraneus]|uniref:Uncharacterized protein n=1 Tax=Desulfofundulus thermosubterraneus DSM 16057 TaxID=1121432 RepID=A0A1M6CH47_9FIRM|nr:hypothetical protein [Desulfofundulus thermosubterraneus]SHI60171.1 hypothetical protein SAMN02745219_00674 [Desulfofundulus thermosubterraneus DSM 16057]